MLHLLRITSSLKCAKKDAKTTIGINSIENNTVQIVGRPWVYTNDYWEVYFAVIERVKMKFDENKIIVLFLHRIAYYTNNSSNNK